MRWGRWFLGLAAAGAAALPLASAAPPLGDEAETCLSCHGDPSLRVELDDGSSVSLHVKPSEFEGSVHAGLVDCTGCHPGMDEFPHPDWPKGTRAAFEGAFRRACATCHPDEHARTLDGVHEALFVTGAASAPGCFDCHGSHSVGKAAVSRAAISDTCSGCHWEVAELYHASVHGKALYERESQDAPVCTDCHRSHDIADPRVASWRIRSPELCAGCHTDETKMSRYGLSTDVLRSYVADFHGMSASLSGARTGKTVKREDLAAVCIDCHGVHDIKKVTDPDSPVLRANLAATCRKCHPGASDAFPAAWLSHYTPSWERAPMVKAVNVFYQWFFIPFMIGGLLLQILLHLWRTVVNR